MTTVFWVKLQLCFWKNNLFERRISNGTGIGKYNKPVKDMNENSTWRKNRGSGLNVFTMYKLNSIYLYCQFAEYVIFVNKISGNPVFLTDRIKPKGCDSSLM